jgi:energy-coupling factor transporter transmembrane protein EcfT
MKEKRRTALLLVVLSIIISYLLSMTNPGIGNMEMKALLNLYLPGIVAIFSMMVFLVFSFGYKNLFLKVQLPLTILLIVFNISTGIYLHYFYSSQRVDYFKTL